MNNTILSISSHQAMQGLEKIQINQCIKALLPLKCAIVTIQFNTFAPNDGRLLFCCPLFMQSPLTIVWSQLST